MTFMISRPENRDRIIPSRHAVGAEPTLHRWPAHRRHPLWRLGSVPTWPHSAAATESILAVHGLGRAVTARLAEARCAGFPQSGYNGLPALAARAHAPCRVHSDTPQGPGHHRRAQPGAGARDRARTAREAAAALRARWGRRER